MTAFEKDIVSLVRAALTGEAPTLSPEADYARIYHFGLKQQIIYMLNAGLCMVDGFEESAAAPQFLQAACAAMAAALRQQQEIGKIRAAFSARGIDFMPLKGTLMRDLYPMPEMRQMGDADILIREEQIDAITAVMQALGYTKAVGDVYEVVWSKSGALRVEFHTQLASERNQDIRSYFAAEYVWARAVKGDGSVYHMTPEDELIFDFAHFVKHFRSSGAGLRNIVDLYVFLQKHRDLNEAYIGTQLKKLDFYRFYLHVLDTLRCWFDGAETTEATDCITGLLFAGGIYGDAETAHQSTAIRYRKQYKFGWAVKFLQLVFPGFRTQRKRYPILEEFPVLYPFSLIYHWFEVLFFRSASIGKAICDSAEIRGDYGQERYAQLRSVGLKPEKAFEKKNT